MGINFLFEKIGALEEYLLFQKLPRDAGFFIKIDLMIREEAKKEDVQKAADSLKLFLTTPFCFSSSLKFTFFLKGYNCTSAIGDTTVSLSSIELSVFSSFLM